MYRVYANGKVLHHPNLFDAGYLLINPVLTEEVNTHGNFTFTIPKGHPLYDDLAERKTIIDIHDDDGGIWRGRIIEITRNIRHEKMVYCEGELAYLCDSLYRPFGYKGSVSGFINAVISNHNAQVGADAQFTVGNITVTDPNDYIVRASQEALDTWTVLLTRCVDLLGGYLVVRWQDGVRYLDYLEDFTQTGQRVEYGVNMLDLQELVSAENVVTRLIPYGAFFDIDDPNYEEQPENGFWDGNRLTIKSVNNDVDYIVNASAEALYGIAWGTEVWDDVTVASNLLTKAQNYLVSLVGNRTIEAKAVDLSLVDESKPRITVGSYVTAYSKPHDINVSLLCKMRVLPLMDVANTEIQLGHGIKTLTDSFRR